MPSTTSRFGFRGVRLVPPILLALLTLFAPLTASGWNKYQHLDDVASWLAQRPVRVRCLTYLESQADPIISFWGASAYVPVDVVPGTDIWLGPKDYTVFAYPLCEDLVNHTGKLTSDYAWALLVIVHESGHLRGATWPLWSDEGEVNCWTLRRMAAVAQLEFGVKPWQVPRLKRLAWDIFIHQPDAYNPSGCSQDPVIPSDSPDLVPD